jgi:hypothetical protein
LLTLLAVLLAVTLGTPLAVVMLLVVALGKGRIHRCIQPAIKSTASLSD